MFLQKNEHTDEGQATIALAGVLALGCFAGLALALVGQAMVHRARARNAADAVALAVVDQAEAATALSDWYLHQGITIEHEADRTIARSGPSQAAAWARVHDVSRQPAPALVAILARAEQLVGVDFSAVRWRDPDDDLRIPDRQSARSEERQPRLRRLGRHAQAPPAAGGSRGL